MGYNVLKWPPIPRPPKKSHDANIPCPCHSLSKKQVPLHIQHVRWKTPPLPESFGDAIALGLLLLRRHLTLGNGPNQVDGELTALQDRFV